MANGRPKVNARIDDWEMAALKLIAEKKGKTVSDIVREAINILLHYYGSAQPDKDA